MPRARQTARKSTNRKKKRGRPRLPEMDRMQTETAQLTGWEILALDAEGDRLGISQRDLRRKKLLRGLGRAVDGLRAAGTG